jgi:hypothetical protein
MSKLQCSYVSHNADFVFKLPDHVSLEEGAFCEPLSVGVHAARRADVSGGDRALILGAGVCRQCIGWQHLPITIYAQGLLDWCRQWRPRGLAPYQWL